jgi:hypothetical protein
MWPDPPQDGNPESEAQEERGDSATFFRDGIS